MRILSGGLCPQSYKNNPINKYKSGFHNLFDVLVNSSSASISMKPLVINKLSES